jgi:large subunit ribosomal protein L19e
MQLNKKKSLASKTLGVGVSKVILNKERLSEIKEAITKQDIRDLHADGAITIKATPGKRKVVKRKNRRRAGSIKKTVSNRKQIYAAMVRKLRAYITNMKSKGTITNELYRTLRKEIRSSDFRSKNHLKERIAQETEEEK